MSGNSLIISGDAVGEIPRQTESNTRSALPKPECDLAPLEKLKKIQVPGLCPGDLYPPRFSSSPGELRNLCVTVRVCLKFPRALVLRLQMLRRLLEGLLRHRCWAPSLEFLMQDICGGGAGRLWGRGAENLHFRWRSPCWSKEHTLRITALGAPPHAPPGRGLLDWGAHGL